MLRYLALTLLVGCSASAGGASFDDAPGEVAGMAGAATEPTAGASIGGGATAGGPALGGSSAGSVVAKGGQAPEPPTAGAPATAGVGGSGGAPAGAGGVGSAGAPVTAGTTAAAGAPSTCPADFYCHELGADAFAKCVIRPADPDPQFPMCTITEGACFYPQTAPESCVKAECWKKIRTCG